MNTTITTNSLPLFEKIQNYFNNKRILTLPSSENGSYSLTLLDLSSDQTDILLHQMTNHFRLISRTQQESCALAA